jgi:cell division protein FtsB
MFFKILLYMRIPKIFFFTFFVSLFLSIYFLVFSSDGIYTYFLQKRKIQELEIKKENLKSEIEDLQKKIELIKVLDREYLEYLFRKFGWVRKDEKIMKFEQDSLLNSEQIQE